MKVAEGEIARRESMVPVGKSVFVVSSKRKTICEEETILQLIFARWAETTKTDFPTGTILSLLAISPSATFISSLGLFYPLDELTLFNWQSRGISNSVTEPEQIITLKNGTALAVVTLQDANQPKS